MSLDNLILIAMLVAGAVIGFTYGIYEAQINDFFRSLKNKLFKKG